MDKNFGIVRLQHRGVAKLEVVVHPVTPYPENPPGRQSESAHHLSGGAKNDEPVEYRIRSTNPEAVQPRK